MYGQWRAKSASGADQGIHISQSEMLVYFESISETDRSSFCSNTPADLDSPVWLSPECPFRVPRFNQENCFFVTPVREHFVFLFLWWNLSWRLYCSFASIRWLLSCEIVSFRFGGQQRHWSDCLYAVWSVLLLSASRTNDYYRISKMTGNAQMILHGCAVTSKSEHISHMFKETFSIWRGADLADRQEPFTGTILFLEAIFHFWQCTGDKLGDFV